MISTDKSKLERSVRRSARLYPQRWRALYEDDLVQTFLDSSSDHTRIDWRVRLDVIFSALTVRVRQSGRRFAFAALLAAMLVAVTFGSGRGISAEFVITSLVVAAIPGTGVFFTVSSAMSGGRSRGLVAALGCTLGIVPHIVAAMLGLSGIMQIGSTFFEVVRWAGVAYLIFMGVSLLRSGDLLGVDHVSHQSTTRRSTRAQSTMATVIRRGILLNLLNPKLTLFFFAFLPPFLDRSSALVNPKLLGLSAVFMAATFAVFSVYALTSAALRDRVLAAPRARVWFQRTLGSLLVGFGVRLAVAKH